MVIERLVQHVHEGTLLEGFLAFEESSSVPRPAVLIAHAWGGRDEFVCNKARMLAGLGYAAFAMDMYGKDVRGNNPETNHKLMAPFMQDRALLQSRMQAALDTVKSLAEVDSERIVAMGFCFGGLCVLDLARTGADLCGVISVHGLFKPAENIKDSHIKARVLVLHGNDDPMVPIEAVVALEQELTRSGADWQLHVYGNTKHAFTNPHANDPVRGTVYNKDADTRSWIMIGNFLKEVLEQ